MYELRNLGSLKNKKREKNFVEKGGEAHWTEGQRQQQKKVFHILHQLGGFDNDDARISDLQNSGGRSRQHWASTRAALPTPAPAASAQGRQAAEGGHIWLW